MPTRVYLLRHAETTHPHMYNGAESDVGLSRLGVRQAEALAPVMARLHPAVVVSSAMRRAVDTAQVLAAACQCPHQLEPDLHERRVGIINGKSHAEAYPYWREMLDHWINGDSEYATEGAESLRAVRERVLPVWDRVTTEHAGRTVVIVGHGNVCKILLLTLLPGWSIADWERFGPIRNLAYSELEGEASSGWQALQLNVLDEAILHVNAEASAQGDGPVPTGIG